MELNVKMRLMEQVEGALDSIRTFLRADGGDVELLDVEDNMNVRLKLLGQCRSCSMSAMTMKAGIEDAIRKAVPEIKSVESVQDN
ncbi:MAG: NifU family protein [Sphingobacteriales bacterium]|nr:MAG: NifU family protein [Sphingobacteriales bacterium]